MTGVKEKEIASSARLVKATYLSVPCESQPPSSAGTVINEANQC